MTKRVIVISCAMIAATLSAAVLVSCGKNEPEPGEIPMGRPIDGRVRVERIATFRDGLAYGSTRGVYVITDTKTGKEFIGVSGVGISEVGSYQSGKTNRQDER